MPQSKVLASAKGQLECYTVCKQKSHYGLHVF